MIFPNVCSTTSNYSEQFLSEHTRLPSENLLVRNQNGTVRIHTRCVSNKARRSFMAKLAALCFHTRFFIHQNGMLFFWL